MLTEKLQSLANPQTLDDVFSDNKEKILYDRLTASLREAALNIKEQMKAELKQISSELVAEAIGKIKIPRDGLDGRDGQGLNGKDGVNGKDAVIDEQKIIAEVIKQIPPVRTSVKRGGGDTIIADDLSSQCTGATRTFTTTKKIGKPILVVSSQFPNVLRLTTDFIASGMTLTLDSNLGFIESGQTLLFLFAEG